MLRRIARIPLEIAYSEFLHVTMRKMRHARFRHIENLQRCNIFALAIFLSRKGKVARALRVSG